MAACGACGAVSGRNSSHEILWLRSHMIVCPFAKTSLKKSEHGEDALMHHRYVEMSSRREFLKRAAGFALAEPMFMRLGKGQSNRNKQSMVAYVGTYSSSEGPEGAIGHGQGIYLFEMNLATGGLLQREIFKNDANPSWLALSPNREYLYSANEISNYNGAKSGSVSAYSVDRESGRLTLLNTISSEGAGPAHVSVHPSGKFVFVANYHGGSVAVLPVGSHGELGAASDVVCDAGSVGPTRSSSAPVGSFAISGHDKSHAHMIQSDAAGKFSMASDLGLDQILIWKFDAATGKLSPADPPAVSLPPGDGPRHFVFHPNGRWFYSLQEEASTLVTYAYDSKSGKLATQQTISTLPKDFKGTNYTSELVISPDARFLYVANRLHDSIAWFSIGEGGVLAFVGEEWTRGDYPRSFNFDPSGRYLFCCNQRSDVITTYAVNRRTGALAFTGEYTPVGTPAVIVFLLKQ
jgi:6-phosphogluconolactonase